MFAPHVVRDWVVDIWSNFENQLLHLCGVQVAGDWHKILKKKRAPVSSLRPDEAKTIGKRSDTKQGGDPHGVRNNTR